MRALLEDARDELWLPEFDNILDKATQLDGCLYA